MLTQREIDAFVSYLFQDYFGDAVNSISEIVGDLSEELKCLIQALANVLDFGMQSLMKIAEVCCYVDNGDFSRTSLMRLTHYRKDACLRASTRQNGFYIPKRRIHRVQHR